MGVTALDSHMKGAKHTACSTARQRQPPIVQFCAPQTSSVTETALAISNEEISTLEALPPQPRNILSYCGSTPTLRAEVMWVLKTISEHHSYTSNENITEIFKTMFPDSEVAATFSCGSNKTAYITKFGLAPFITKELTDQVNMANGFVVMFDESLNKMTKSKQLDLHIRYWVDDHVQSRYFGSQFMGHATAVDLLKHFKVSFYSEFLKC